MSGVVAFAQYGGPEVLELTEVAEPQAGPGHVRVRVRAAGVQPFDCKLRAGIMREFVPVDFPQQLGNELAGEVDQVGAGVSAFAVGDAVLGYASFAGYAELSVVPATQLIAKPAAMPWEVAGTLSASGQTAHTAVEALAVRPGETLLIHAAAGGVGTFAVQIACARGIRVIGTASTRNHEYLRSLGAEPVAYGDGLAQRVAALAPDGVHAAFDAAGTDEAIAASLELVADRQRIGTIAAMPAASQHGIRWIETDRAPRRLSELAELHAAGRLHVPIHRTFSLAEAAAAHCEVETGHVRGKVVLTP